MTTPIHNLPLPLTGIRVLDATHIVAGPFCSLILADMGAEVIKIERPRTGDLSRGRGPFLSGPDGQQVSSRYLGINRNKKSVTLDLRNPSCKEAFRNLVQESDVLIDNWGSRRVPAARTGLRHPPRNQPPPGLRQHYRIRRQRRPARSLFRLARQQPQHPGDGRMDGGDRRARQPAPGCGRQHRRLRAWPVDRPRDCPCPAHPRPDRAGTVGRHGDVRVHGLPSRQQHERLSVHRPQSHPLPGTGW